MTEALILLEPFATQVENCFFHLSGAVTLLVYNKCMSKYPGALKYMLTCIHVKINNCFIAPAKIPLELCASPKLLIFQ